MRLPVEKRLPAILILGCAGAFGLAIPASAQPRIGGSLNCSAATLAAGSTYGYAISGFFDSTPIANYGFFTSDGVGTFSGSATVSVGGGIGSGLFAARYTVASNCTGAAVITNTLGQVFHLAFTINANGAVMDFVETDVDFTVAGTAAPLAPSCEASAFSGPYTYSISGWLTSTGVNIPYADAGRIVADGNGNFTGKSTFATYVAATGGAAAIRRTLSGSYTVNAGCQGTVAVSDNLGNTGTLALTLVNDGQQALFINTTPGTVVTGHLYRGQNTCSSSSLSGPFVYSVNGAGVATDVFIPVAYSGFGTANGNGSLSGSDYIANVDLNDAVTGNGVVLPRTFTATYTVNSDCSGSEVVKDSLGETANIDLYVADQGGIVEFIQTDPDLVISGQAQSLPSGSCSNATLNGAYGYSAEGWLLAPALSADAGAGQIIFDGNGNVTGAVTSAAFLNIYPENETGTYQINSNCTGSAIFSSSLGISHFQLFVSPNGEFLYSIETDADTVVASYAQYQVTQPTAAIVNLGSYTSQVAPGGLISIFGSGFTNGSTQTANGAPWPPQLDGVTVKVNGSPIPIYYVNSVQIDAQLPVNIATGPAQLVVEAGTQSTAAATFTVSAAAPGILTYGPLRAVAQDFTISAAGELVGPAGAYSEPASPGDELVVYLVDGGAVNASSGSWTTGAASPGSFSVTAPYTVTIGGVPAKVAYFGLTDGFVGLYQVNVQVPSLPSGDHTLTITEGGVASASALITVIN